MQYIDLHSHFLPGIDDGCQTVEESMNVLKESYRQNVIAMAATPHYYSQEPVAEFLEKRQEAYDKLCAALAQESDSDSQKISIPQICLGAEVAYRTGISREEDLHKLCYGKSDFLLLEMPFSRWKPEVLKEVEYMIRSRGIVPVIAHLERYAHFQNRAIMEALYEMNVLIQMNAEYYSGFFNMRKARRQIMDGLVNVMGSDAHNMTKRPPNLGKTMDLMIHDGLEEDVKEMMEEAEGIFSEAAGIKV